MIFLSAENWQAAECAHGERLAKYVEAHLARKGCGETEPVLDFLFSYYSLRPAPLLKWSPGLGVVLEGVEAEKFLADTRFQKVDGGVALDQSRLHEDRAKGLQWTLALLTTVQQRRPAFNCFGLHEWAMVFAERDIRHSTVPLRLTHEEIDEFVKSQNLSCTHFDAFRFFTREARPLNRHELSRESQISFDQPGCVHVSMDLYKWAYKLSPWIDSAILADAFELAMKARILDMQASPYDLSGHGYSPVLIETVEGREEYESRQKELTRLADPVRERLITAYSLACNAWPVKT
ncbi:MAG: 3-methyladenine DNA glycosylase [Verrucomicrobiota bacterium]|nr:3-methyladenine DNA glycosylase [Verrucomicrobiota bacterium]